MAVSARFLFALFFFIMDVKVKAGVLNFPVAASLVTAPAGCRPGEVGCSLKTLENQKFRLSVGDATVVMGEETALVPISAGEVLLLSGVLWIESKGGLTVRTLYGDIRGAGAYWMRHESGRIRVGVIENEVEIFLRDGERLYLMVGMENWMGPLSGGRSTVGIPRSSVLREIVELWARMSFDSKRQFTAKVRKFMSQWHGGVKTLSLLHGQMAARRIAGHVEEKRLAEERHRSLRAEEAKIRDLFRLKNYYK